MNTKEKGNGDKPAYPVEVEHYEGKISGIQTGNTTGFEMGLSKRELFAAICLGHAVDKWYNHPDEELVARSIKLSKELLRQLES